MLTSGGKKSRKSDLPKQYQWWPASVSKQAEQIVCSSKSLAMALAVVANV